jgi:c-di-GMP-binding flagellar brake protein YcgR
MQQERRRYSRTNVACPVRVYGPDHRLLVTGKTVDISAGGVKILGPAPDAPAPGDIVDLEIGLVLPNTSKKRQVNRQATVRRVEPMGQWASVSLEFLQKVDL